MCKLGICRVYCLAQVSEVSPAGTQYEFNPWLFVLNHREDLPLSDVKFIDQTQTRKPKLTEQCLGLQSLHLAWVEPCPRVITKGAQHSPLAMRGSQYLGRMLRYKSPIKRLSGKGRYYLFPEEGRGKVIDALVMCTWCIRRAFSFSNFTLKLSFVFLNYVYTLKLQIWRLDIPCYTLQWILGFISVTSA